MEKRFVHLLMIAIVITCPIRCMVQGCGGGGCTPLSASSVDSGCCCNSSSSESSELPVEPCEKCSCSCFCAGATIPDSFEVDPSLDWQPVSSLERMLDVYDMPVTDSYWETEPPDFLGGNDSGNIGRAIRHQHSSLLN